jgi:hypothetical protein
MTDPHFRSRLQEACDVLFAAEDASAVADACRHLAGSVAPDAMRRAVQYRMLREVVDAAARHADPTRYTRLVAMHDTLLHDATLVPDANPTHPRLFDESFYLETQPDVAAAVRAGTHRDGFAHFVQWGSREGRAAHPWRAGGPTPPTVRAPLGSERDQGVTWARRLAGAPPTSATDRSRNAAIGINLIGFHSSNLGMGTSVRNYYRLLVEAGFSVCPVDVPLPGHRWGHDTTYADRFVPLDQPTPHAVNLFLLNPPDVRNNLAMRIPALQTAGRINMALPFWELPRLPEPWVPLLQQMDVVLAATTFLEHAMAMDITGPLVRRLPHPLHLPEPVVADRRRWQLPERTTVFVTSFEMASDVNRKNPFATVLAFERALGGDPRALLLVRINDVNRHPDHTRHLELLYASQARCANIRVIADVRKYADVLSLFASCDVLVSLHRAEGLGLCLMEAMTLGKPVIATDWSGNMDFMTEQNACLVGHDLVPVVGCTAQYSGSMLRSDSRWAEPRIDDAARWMRRLVDEPELRVRIGHVAAGDMADYQRRIDASSLRTTIENLRAVRHV